MLSRARSWLFCFVVFLSLRFLKACEPPTGTNFTQPPQFWCSLKVQLSITGSCGVAVEETITVPWTSGILSRIIPTEDSQKLEDLSAYRILSGQRVKNLSVTQKYQSPNNNQVSVQTGKAPEAASVLIAYTKTAGVRVFSECARTGGFKDVPSSQANTVMYSDWAVGGMSVADVQRVAVTFILQAQRLKYIDTLTTGPETLQPELKNDANSSGDHIRITYNGSTTEASPSDLFFFIRYYMPFGAQSCSASRNCEYESIILNEGQSSEFKYKVILGVCVTLGLILAGGGIAALFSYCRRKKEGQMDSGAEENLPESLRHFEYDTGGEQGEERMADEVWMNDKNEVKEEIYALDLSPRNQAKKDRDGF